MAVSVAATISMGSFPFTATAVTRCWKSTISSPLIDTMRDPAGTPASQAGIPGVGVPMMGASAGRPANITSGRTTSAKTTFMITPPE